MQLSKKSWKVLKTVSSHLKDILVLSEMKTAVNDTGCYRCRDRRCRVCDFLVECIDFRSRVTGGKFVFYLVR